MKLFACAIAGLGTASILACITKRYFRGATCECSDRLECKTVVITGATSGIGRALAFEVAQRGAGVILACRDVDAATQLCEEVIKATGNKKVHALQLDLCDFSSIDTFVEQLAIYHDNIYALVNNAAVFYLPQTLTKDNFDITFQTNYLGPFYLTLKVLPLLEENSRVVNVSSEAHRLCTYLDLPKRASLFEVYGHSKLCLNLFTRKLASLLENKTAVAVDPGNVETNIFRHYPLLSNPILKVLFWPIRFLTIKTPQQGAQSVLYALLTPEITPACYIRECKQGLPNYLSQRDFHADTLWYRSLQWTGLKEKEVLAAGSAKVVASE